MSESRVAETATPAAKADAPEAPKAEAVKAPVKAEVVPPAVTEQKIEKAPQPAKAAAPAKTREPVRKAVPAKKIAEAKPTPAKRIVKKIAKPARAGVKPLKQGAETVTKQTNETGVFAAEQIKSAFGDVNARAKTAMEKSAKIVEELADLTRGNVEALVASSKVAAKGVETLSQDAAEYGRKSFEEASTALKSFAEVKSATDFFRLQSDFARSAFDAAVAESARVSEAMIKIAGDVAEPITSRYAVAAERVKTLAA